MAGIRKVTGTETSALVRRLIGSMPASRFEMETLCRLAGIEASRSLATAAVECKRRPRLLINPDFVAKYCKRDEHLFLLVMHELWHVMLAHTRMYPRMTTAQNIAFDAIINSGLMREFDSPEYQGFFDAVNAADKFPGCLLRPPVGWPLEPEYLDEVGPPGTKELVMRLYPPGNLAFYDPPMYEEVLSLLLKTGSQWFTDAPMLLGNHDNEPIHDPIMKDLMKQIRSKWPQMQIPGYGTGGTMGWRSFPLSPVGDNVRRVFAQVLRICISPRPGREQRRSKVPVSALGGTGVLPNPRDRLAAARTRLGMPETLWAQPTTLKARLREKPTRAYVYLDVSGSMYQVLAHLLGLMLPYVANQQAEVFQFSTQVKAFSFSDLRVGRLATTGGTNINCVMAHLFELPKDIKRVLLLTDGEVGQIQPEYATRIREENIRLYVVMPSDGSLHPSVAELAASVVCLPPLQ
ncbi:MAG TPA: VWA domain-containing protein [Phototrophicaceae bacterium]|jgi:hypothetical protein|nr:VWA domain-containing protein [Phototrophicaceae bacterium]